MTLQTTTRPVAEADSEESAVPRRASGSSFYMAMRILPRARREGMFEIYSFCRLVDDIADSDAPRRERLEQLAHWRADVDALYAGRVPPQRQGLARAIREFALRKEDFIAVIDGMEMDAAADIRAPDLATLDLYCDRVASAVGRLSVRVFGMETQEGQRLAHHLGRALQLTNILRDIDEDAAVGRLYLPREALREAGIDTTDPQAAAASPALAKACGGIVDIARGHFAEAETIMAASSRRAVRAPRIMGKVYRAMLDRMVARGWAAPRERVRIGRLHLLAIVLRHAFI
jgi:phytoene synthase